MYLTCHGKKIRFCRQAIMELGLKNCEAVQARVESFDSSPFEQITSRAFTSLDNMVGWLDHLLVDDTELLAMKGTVPDDEISHLNESGYQIKTESLQVPFVTGVRHLVRIVQDTFQVRQEFLLR